MLKPWCRLATVSALLFLPIPSARAHESCTRNLDGPSFPIRSLGSAGTLQSLQPLPSVDLDQDGTGDRLVITTDASGRHVMRVAFGPGRRVELREALALLPQPAWSESRFLLADFDGDSTVDLLELPLNGAIIYRGLGGRSFDTGVVDPAMHAHRNPAVGDFDGDGRIELLAPVWVGFGWQLRAYHWSRESGWEVAWFVIPRAPLDAIWAGDFNGDGLDDIAYRIDDQFSTRMDVLLGDRSAPLAQLNETPLPGFFVFQGVLDGGAGRDGLFARLYTPSNEIVRFDWFADPDGRLVERWRRPAPGRTRNYRPLVEDLDGDGTQDLWFTSGPRDYRGYELLRCAPDGCDPSARDLLGESALGVRDLDGDGTGELIFLEPGVGIGALRGAGELRFNDPRVSVEEPLSLGGRWGGDFNEDGRLDVLTWNYSDAAAPYRVQLGNGDGSFTERPGPAPPPSANIREVLDLDGDAHLDLVAVAAGSPRSVLAVAWGRGDATFEGWQPSSFAHSIIDLEWADIDRNGTLDLALDVYVASSAPRRMTQLHLLDGRRWIATGSINRDAADPLESLADVDGDGQLDLLTNRTVPGAAGARQEALEWTRLIAGRPQGTLPFSRQRFDRIADLEAGDFDGDGLADMILLGRGSDPHVALHGDGGRGEARSIWQGPAFESYPLDRLVDLDGDGIRDLVAARGGIRFRRGDGTGSFGPIEGPWIGGGLSWLPGDVDGGGTLDLLMLASDGATPETRRWLWQAASGHVAEDDTQAPALQFSPRPNLDYGTGVPGWSGLWRIAARAIDDCRSARVTSIRLQLEPASGSESVSYHAAPVEEIQIARSSDGSTRVVLRGPDQERLSRWITAGRSAGLDLPRNHLMRLEEHAEAGTPMSEFPEAVLLQRVVFEGGLPARVDSYAPSAGIAIALEGSDWLGKASTRSVTFGAAKTEYCAGTESEAVACR